MGLQPARRSAFLIALLACMPALGNASVDSIAVANRVASEMDARAGLGGEDLGLDAIHRQLLERNPEILAARRLLEGAGGQRLVFRSEALPRVSLGLPAGFISRRGDTDSRTFVLITGQLSQPLFDVAVPASWRSGDLALLAAQQNLNVTVSSRLHAARQAYLRALHARGILGVLAEIEDALQQNRAFERQRVEAGLAARSDLIRAEVQQLNRGPERDFFTAEYRTQLVRLAELIGADLKRPGEIPFRPLGHLAYQPFPLDLVRLNAEAQRNRPDLVLLEILVGQSVEGVRLAAAGFYPTIRLVANGQAVPGGAFRERRSDVVRAGDDVENSEILFGPALTWQIYDGGATAGRKESAAARQAQAQLRLQELREDIPRALAAVSKRIRTSEEKIRVLGSNVALAERTLAITQKSLQAGQAGQLDILEAQRSLFDTKAGLLNAILENALSVAELDLITGRYLNFSHVAEPAAAR